MPRERTTDLGIAGLSDAELIGTGGFAVVYKAEQPAFRRTIAVKLLMVGHLDEATSHRFERECQLMGSLSEHPSIVTMFDAGFTAEGRPYLLMAYMPGGSLEDRLAATGPVPWQEAVPICVRMAGALEVAHRSDVVHRDVKPANILLSTFGEPQLTDFGIARMAGGPETRSGIITASMAHAAPEVIDGLRPGPAADVYSLGSTLYALLAGEPAFTRESDESVFPLLLRVRTEPVPDLRPRGVPDAVCAAIEAAMEKAPGDRPESAQALGELLREAERRGGLAPTSMLLGFESDATPVAARVAPEAAEAAPAAVNTDAPTLVVTESPAAPPPEPAPPAPARRRWWPLAAMAAVVAIAAVVGALALFSGNGDPAGDAGGGDPVVADQGRLEPGREVPGLLRDLETHRFTFDGAEGIVAGVEMRAPDPATDSFVRVFAPDGAEVAADDDLGGGVGGVDALALFVMPTHGTYTIEASNRTGDAAEYTIGLFFEAATLLHPPVVTDDALDFSPTDRRLYVVTARAGERIEVVMASEQPGLDPFLVVYGPSEELGRDDDSAGGIEDRDAVVRVTAPVDGSYRIVAGHSDETGGRFRLEVVGPGPG